MHENPVVDKKPCSSLHDLWTKRGEMQSLCHLGRRSVRLNLSIQLKGGGLLPGTIYKNPLHLLSVISVCLSLSVTGLLYALTWSNASASIEPDIHSSSTQLEKAALGCVSRSNDSGYAREGYKRPRFPFRREGHEYIRSQHSPPCGISCAASPMTLPSQVNRLINSLDIVSPPSIYDTQFSMLPTPSGGTNMHESSRDDSGEFDPSVDPISQTSTLYPSNLNSFSEAWPYVRVPESPQGTGALYGPTGTFSDQSKPESDNQHYIPFATSSHVEPTENRRASTGHSSGSNSWDPYEGQPQFTSYVDLSRENVDHLAMQHSPVMTELNMSSGTSIPGSVPGYIPSPETAFRDNLSLPTTNDLAYLDEPAASHYVQTEATQYAPEDRNVLYPNAGPSVLDSSFTSSQFAEHASGLKYVSSATALEGKNTAKGSTPPRIRNTRHHVPAIIIPGDRVTKQAYPRNRRSSSTAVGAEAKISEASSSMSSNRASVPFPNTDTSIAKPVRTLVKRNEGKSTQRMHSPYKTGLKFVFYDKPNESRGSALAPDSSPYDIDTPSTFSETPTPSSAISSQAFSNSFPDIGYSAEYPFDSQTQPASSNLALSRTAVSFSSPHSCGGQPENSPVFGPVRGERPHITVCPFEECSIEMSNTKGDVEDHVLMKCLSESVRALHVEEATQDIQDGLMIECPSPFCGGKFKKILNWAKHLHGEHGK
ncbi:hypothetical protein DFH11DRAFT_844220 [Phellopilus nigrolimitatus]|nr:hypothetical protein DFH11DRAFT_844220 [Phellopilus nigrolimitatus]